MPSSLNLPHIEMAHILSSIAELACGIICGCLPVCPAFFQYLHSKVKPKVSKAFNAAYSTSRGRRENPTPESGSHDQQSGLWDTRIATNVPLTNQEHVELDERHPPLGTQTAVKDGGRMEFPTGVVGPRSQERSRGEDLIVPNAIRKTTRVEQSTT